ncbi:MAG: tRNA pseudouridine(38-40) synthase TruA [Planctomycetaceae bacterium]|nr:tRNA pseudouridine(38-40) synthase TruA [Planctomycetaceae bacterium]
MSAKTLKLTVAYDGAEYCGWQRQPQRRTVQGELERAWLAITSEEVTFNAAGRTDSGVHAAGQVASVDSETTVPVERLADALNSHLPADMLVVAAEHAPAGFHATHDAHHKRYRYSIYTGRSRPLFCRGFAWHVPAPLDVAAMQRGADLMVGTHDFASLQSVGSPRENTVRTIFEATVCAGGEGMASPVVGAGQGGAVAIAPGSPLSESADLITIDVVGDGFLYHMVRTIAGTLADVGRGRRPPEWVAEAIAARDRGAAGQTAPAHGLMLVSVDY